MVITIIGTGFVGVVTAAVYASLGHEVVGLDIDQAKVKQLNAGKVPFYEPQLESLLKKQLDKKTLRFTTDYKSAIPDSDVILIAVGTPSAADGQADLTYVFKASESLAPHIKKDAIIALKSTAPPGSLNELEKIIKQHTKVKFHLASLPEFLREGTAVADTLSPDRIVIGATNEFTFNKLEELHQPFDSEIIKVSPESAQMGKYTANAYLANRITFINHIADLCQKNGADIDQVIEVIGKDRRIGDHYWYPGFGYGGSCFPKDVDELAAYSRAVGESDNLLNAISKFNTQRIPRIMSEIANKIGGWKDKKVAVLGLSFKPNTNDMREAPSVKVVPILLEKGAKVAAFDPEALEVATGFIKDHKNLKYTGEIETAVKGADVIMALIEWQEIVAFDFTQTKEDQDQWFVDARNQFDKRSLEKAGYKYMGIGK